MRFHYYEDISFLDNEEENDAGIPYWDYIPEPSIINWENFKGLDHVLCIYIDMDGNIYRINSQKPVPIWRHFNYIGSLSNTNCDLEVAVRRISKLKDVKNVKIIEIPYYNRSKDTHAIEFDYKRPTEKDIHKELNKFYPKKYFI